MKILRDIHFINDNNSIYTSIKHKHMNLFFNDVSNMLHLIYTYVPSYYTIQFNNIINKLNMCSEIYLLTIYLINIANDDIVEYIYNIAGKYKIPIEVIVESNSMSRNTMLYI